ncbi:MAG: Methyltransferase type 11 [Chthonomonadales bacterium]|nr:Methyltransferase type 11 [Chthonomonadales bacterium]
MALIYDYEAGFDDPSNKNAWFGRIIGERKRVLEVGCATGYVGEYLVKNQKCCLYGVEYVAAAAETARKRDCYKQVVVGDIQAPETVAGFEAGSFDYILFGDVLEHLISPEKALELVKPLLTPEGHILICVPSIVHWSLRRNMLLGKFEYTETGPMDRTHVHFFTPKTIRELVRQQNLKICQEGGVVWLPSLLNRLPTRLRRGLEGFAARLCPNLAYGQVLLDVTHA